MMENQRICEDDRYLEKWENDGELENMGRLWRTKEYGKMMEKQRIQGDVGGTRDYGKMMENQRIYEDYGELEIMGR